MVKRGSSSGTFAQENSSDELSDAFEEPEREQDSGGFNVNCYRQSCLENKDIKQEFQLSSDEIFDVIVGDSGNFELRLSPEGFENHQEPAASHTADDSSATSERENTSSGQSNSSHNSLTSICSGPVNSADMVSITPEVLSQEMFQETPPMEAPEDARSSDADVECRQSMAEVWNTQQLADVNHRLRVRRKQVKRLIMTVIRKRQMAEETLEAFKKRLKSL